MKNQIPPMLHLILATRRLTLCIVVAVLLMPWTQLFASETPFELVDKSVWEVGLGAGYLNDFDYPGSKDKNMVQGVLPFFIYRSPVFRFGGGGIGAVAVEQPRLKVDLSLGFALNAKSEPDGVRKGLPDLDVLFEIGPGILVRLIDRQVSDSGRTQLDWETGLRAVFSTDFKSVGSQGYSFSTGLKFKQSNLFDGPVSLIANFDVIFGSERFQRYLYEVPVEFATENRQAYKAKAGYLESTLFLGFALRPRDNIRIFTGVEFGQYANAANEDSPLFETSGSTAFALGFVWSAWQSERVIPVLETE